MKLMISQCNGPINCIEAKYRLEEEENSCLEPDAIDIRNQLESGRSLCECQYAYWYSDPHPNSPHNTGLDEDEVRQKWPEYAKLADKYMIFD